MTVMLIAAWGMGLFPLAFLLWYLGRDEVRRRLEEQDAEERVARSKRLAFGLTLAGVLVLVLFSSGAFGPPEDLSGPLSGVGFGLFHFVWWFACAPILNSAEARQPIAVVGTPMAQVERGTVRAASLTAREESDYLPRWWWVVPIAMLGLGTGWIAWQLFEARPAAASTWVVGTMMPLGALSFLVGYGWWARRMATGVQDVGGAADPISYEAALDGFRRFMARGIFLMMTAAVALFVGAGVAVVATQGDPEAQGWVGGWVGGGGGSLVGILGALFGTICSLKRMRLERIRRGDGAPPEGVAAR